MIHLLLDAGLPRGAAAERDGRAVVTLDHDFPHLLFLEAAATPSVILLRVEGLDRRATVELLRSVVPQVVDDLRSGAIVSVDWSGARVRALPVK